MRSVAPLGHGCRCSEHHTPQLIRCDFSQISGWPQWKQPRPRHVAPRRQGGQSMWQAISGSFQGVASVSASSARRLPALQKRFWVPHNPLKRSSQAPLDVPDGFLARTFGDAALPLHIDIGSDRGVFCLGMADANPNVNFLGLEIREKPVQQAMQDPMTAELPNCAFLHANANCHLCQLVPHLKGIEVTSISINFPDPWTKKKHKKRRVLQPEFMPVLADALSTEGRLIVQSDVLELASDMRECARQCNMFRDLREDGTDWMADQPPVFPVSTEWEAVASKRGLPVYRFVMQRL